MKILFVCTAFAPENEIGCIRTTKLAKFLVRAGHDVTVISPTIIEGMNVSNDLLCEELEKLDHIHVSYSEFFQNVFYRKRNTLTQSGAKNKMRQERSGIKRIVYKFVEVAYTEYRNRNWMVQVRKYLQKHDLDGFDVVLSSYPSLSAHWLGYYVKNTGAARKWIADFRDPLVLESSTGIERIWLQRRQRKIVKEADITTHVSRAGTDQFVCDSEDRGKVRWLPNGYDEDDFRNLPENIEENYRDSKTLTFSYAGGLYSGERNCAPLFKAIRELINEKRVPADSIVFDYAGKDGAILKSQAEPFGMLEIIKDHGLMPRDKAIQMQSASDCVVVATFCYTDNGGAMTGKIYEPIMMRKPILMIVTGPGKNSEPGTFVKELNAGPVYEESTHHGDVTVLKDAILEMLHMKMANGHVESDMIESKRNEYSYTNITRKLEKLIQGS